MPISFRGVHKFGHNASVDTAFEPIVDEAAQANAFPAVEAETTIVSSDIADDEGSTGAITVEVLGIGDAGEYIMETVTLDGTNAVTLANDYRIILRAFVITAGSSQMNEGRIDFLHTATIIASIAINESQTQIAAWFFDVSGKGGQLDSMEVHVSSISSVICDFQLILLRGGVKRNQHLGELTSNNPSEILTFTEPMFYEPGDLIFMQAKVSAGTKSVDCSFGIKNH